MYHHRDVFMWSEAFINQEQTLTEYKLPPRGVSKSATGSKFMKSTSIPRMPDVFKTLEDVAFAQSPPNRQRVHPNTEVRPCFVHSPRNVRLKKGDDVHRFGFAIYYVCVNNRNTKGDMAADIPGTVRSASSTDHGQSPLI